MQSSDTEDDFLFPLVPWRIGFTMFHLDFCNEALEQRNSPYIDDLGLPNVLEAPLNDESSSCHP